MVKILNSFYIKLIGIIGSEEGLEGKYIALCKLGEEYKDYTFWQFSDVYQEFLAYTERKLLASLDFTYPNSNLKLSGKYDFRKIYIEDKDIVYFKDGSIYKFVVQHGGRWLEVKFKEQN